MSYRVVQWSTGNVGLLSLRSLIGHPEFELVGLHAHSPDKIGKDAGEIAGVSEKTGIIATNDADALIALEPDAVVYTANGEFRAPDALADMVKILSAGINVVGTSLIYLIYPPAADPALVEPLEKACKEGNSTLFVNGIDPGFSGDVLPLAALQISDRVKEIRCQEIADYSTYADPDFTGFSFGFGKPESFTPMIAMPGVLTGSWGGMVQMAAKILGVEIEETREVFERYFADHDFETDMMPIKKGECSAVRFRFKESSTANRSSLRSTSTASDRTRARIGPSHRTAAAAFIDASSRASPTSRSNASRRGKTATTTMVAYTRAQCALSTPFPRYAPTNPAS